MRVIYNDSTEPEFNLAAEEYLLDSADDNVFMLWRNEPSVIIGAYQNAYAEVDLGYVRQHSINVVRRITGGGAVFHDLGNVNYTYIFRGVDGSIDFEKYTEPIITCLGKMGVNAHLDGRNDITADDRKISGNAQCKRPLKSGGYALLHHGTLLFSADMSKLSGALNVREIKLEGKGIKSVRSRVANIVDLPNYCGPRDVCDFISAVFANISNAEVTSLSQHEISEIESLAARKYKTWEWNFGRSPEFSTSRIKKFPFGTVELYLKVDRGVIEHAEIFGDYFSLNGVVAIESALIGAKLSRDSIARAISSASIGSCISGMTQDDLLSMFE